MRWWGGNSEIPQSLENWRTVSNKKSLSPRVTRQICFQTTPNSASQNMSFVWLLEKHNFFTGFWKDESLLLFASERRKRMLWKLVTGSTYTSYLRKQFWNKTLNMLNIKNKLFYFRKTYHLPSMSLTLQPPTPPASVSPAQSCVS